MAELKRGLKSRHLTMIGIGGAIGTGLFLALGASLSTAGPGGTIVAYLAIGLMVYFLMTGLGELATFMPVAGSFETYATKFVDPSLGFALGWNFWYNWAITLAAELSAGALVMRFWFPDVPAYLWSAIFLSILFLLNYLSAKSFGEAEFWFASIKVFTVLIFLVLGIGIIFGWIGASHEAIGMRNFHVGEAPFVGGLLGVFNVFMVAGFAFQGTELVGTAAGESENPERDVPRAMSSVFWRILFFYVGAIVVVSFIIPYTDPNLLNGNVENIAISPFTLVFERAGLSSAATIMNLVLLTSVLSAGNSGMYASTRMLYALAKSGKAPKLFGKVNHRGVPINALLITAAVGMMTFLASLFGDGAVYTWLVNASGLAGFITWVGIAVSHYRFRKAFVAQGRSLKELKYRAKFFPFGCLFALSICLVVIFGQNYQAFMGDEINWNGIMVSYIGLPLFLGVWFLHKIIKKTKMVPLKECDFSHKIASDEDVEEV